ncbi:MAG: hypothetical protein ABI778_12070 [Ignavibacteriota bacterium]
MKSRFEISVKESLEELSLPAFYTDDQRLSAYYTIMEYGSPIEKVIANKIVGVYPFETLIMSARAA